jgi:hypothetical protein
MEFLIELLKLYDCLILNLLKLNYGEECNVKKNNNKKIKAIFPSQ